MNNTIRKNIDLRRDDVQILKLLAANEGTDVKNYIQNIVSIHALENYSVLTKKKKK